MIGDADRNDSDEVYLLTFTIICELLLIIITNYQNLLWGSAL